MNLHGFIYGDPPRDGKERMCLALIWPRSPHTEYDGITDPEVAFGWMTTVGFMKDDGWIGWNYTTLLYHPTPMQARRPGQSWLTFDVWLSRLIELIS